MYTILWMGNLEERDHSEDTGIDGRKLLVWVARRGLDSSEGSMAGPYEHGNGPSGSI
jgi:hypothetical protein